MFRIIGFIFITLFIDVSGIQLEGFKTEYNRHDKIEYSIINKTGKPQLVQIAIEVKIGDDDWDEAVSDATNVYNMKEAVAYPIEKDGRKSFSHTIGFGNGFFPKDKLPIRFKVTYRNEVDSMRKIVYSNPIFINK